MLYHMFRLKASEPDLLSNNNRSQIVAVELTLYRLLKMHFYSKHQYRRYQLEIHTSSDIMGSKDYVNAL